jgi:Ricin-type beta-trefoil lectin domain
MKSHSLTLLSASSLLALTLIGCVVDDVQSQEAEDDLSVTDSELISTSLRGVASRANTNFCFENVNAQVRLRTCVDGRNQQKFRAEVIAVSGPTLRQVQIRANSGNCLSAGTNSGNFVVLRPCPESTKWFEFDFSGNSVFLSSDANVAIAVDSASDNEPVRVRPLNTGSNQQRWFNK